MKLSPTYNKIVLFIAFLAKYVVFNHMPIINKRFIEVQVYVRKIFPIIKELTGVRFIEIFPHLSLFLVKQE